MASLFGGVLELSHVGHRSPLIGEKEWAGVGGERVRGMDSTHKLIHLW